MAESEEELRVIEENEKVVLKLNIKKTKIMASDLNTSCQIEGVKVEAVTDFLSWALKSLRMVTAAMKLENICFLEESYDKPRQHAKKKKIFC